MRFSPYTRIVVPIQDRVTTLAPGATRVINHRWTIDAVVTGLWLQGIDLVFGQVLPSELAIGILDGSGNELVGDGDATTLGPGGETSLQVNNRATNSGWLGGVGGRDRLPRWYPLDLTVRIGDPWVISITNVDPLIVPVSTLVAFQVEHRSEARL